MGLRQFLVSTKSRLTGLEDEVKVHLVTGNESCDLDSVVSACTYAYFLHKTDTDNSTLYLPVLHTTRQTFQIKLEIVYFLGKHGITADDLVFTEDLDLPDLVEKKGQELKVTLVDHHALHRSMECLRPAVVEVIDHHLPQEGDLPQSWRVDNQRIGSCCSLISQRLLTAVDTGHFLMGQTEAELLLGTILTDTGNLSTRLNVATPSDHNVVLQLQKYLPSSVSPDDIFEEIRAKKFDLSSLTVLQMLQKDSKTLRGSGQRSGVTVVMSSVSMPMETLIVRPEFVTDTEDYMTRQSAQVLVIMTIDKQRHIAIISNSLVYKDQITDVLLQSVSPNLNLQSFTSPDQLLNVRVFLQGNFEISRKGVLPLIRDFLAG